MLIILISHTHIVNTKLFLIIFSMLNAHPQLFSYSIKFWFKHIKVFEKKLCSAIHKWITKNMVNKFKKMLSL